MDDYIKLPCERCGSKKRISKTWKEKIPTYTGEVEVEYSQIVCTNEVCQAAFDKVAAEEETKRKKLQQKKEANLSASKNNAAALAQKNRKHITL